MKPTFSIVIPNLNGAIYLHDCLPALKHALKNFRSEIILVDNNSEDDSIIVTKRHFPTAKIIRNQQNNGFAKAVNQGIAKSKHPWVVLLNNDLVIKENWFRLISPHIGPKYSVYCGTVLTKDGQKYESVGFEFMPQGRCLNLKNGQKYNSKDIKQQNPSQIWGTSAALAIYNKKILQQIGNFDADFFAYNEDVDICLRLNDFGQKTLYIPQAISYHLGGGTSSRFSYLRQYYTYRNWLFIIIKNYSVGQILHNFPNIILERLKNLSYLQKNCHYYEFPFLIIKSIIETLFMTPKLIQKRHQFQKLLKSNMLSIHHKV